MDVLLEALKATDKVSVFALQKDGSKQEYYKAHQPKHGISWGNLNVCRTWTQLKDAYETKKWAQEGKIVRITLFVSPEIDDSSARQDEQKEIDKKLKQYITYYRQLIDEEGFVRPKVPRNIRTKFENVKAWLQNKGISLAGVE